MKKTFFAVLLAVIFYSCDLELLPPRFVVSPYLSDLSFIPAPVKDENPLLEFETPEFTGTVLWKQYLGIPVYGPFLEGESYTAEICLTPKQDYTFKGFSGTFFHRDALSVAQSVSPAPDSADVVIKFDRLPFMDADFISLSGTRLKTFRMTKDPALLEQNVSISFAGAGSYLDSEGFIEDNNISYVYEPKPTEKEIVSTFYNAISARVPLKAFFSAGSYATPVSGQIFRYKREGTAHQVIYKWSNPTIDGTQKHIYYTAVFSYSSFSRTVTDLIPITTQQIADYELNETETFSCKSYTVPENGYTADKNYFEVRNLQIPIIKLSADLSKTISNLTASSTIYGEYEHVPLSSAAVTYPVLFRQVSREFFVYKTISISYDASSRIIEWGWKGGSPIDKIEIDFPTNTLTASFKSYNTITTGEMFYFFILAEDGSIHRKAVIIGKESLP